MKIFYFLLTFFLGLNFCSVFAQSPRDIEKIANASNLVELQKIAQEEEIRFKKNKAEAYRLAQLRGVDTLVELPNGGLRQLIGIDGEDLLYFETNNIGGAASTRANQLHSNPSLGLNLEGENLTAHVWDGGLANINHIEYGDENNFSRYIIGNPNTNRNAHSAHVTGSIMAKGVDPDAKGTAPKSTVKGFNWNNDISEGALEVANGMLISNHSYGFNASNIPTWYFGSYIQRSRAWDNIQYNAPYFLMINSAGNDGTSTENDSPLNPNFPQFDKLSGRKTGKNGIVVANAEDVVTTSNGDYISALINSSSSQGPTNDYRIKPDITALGTSINSTRQGTSNYDILSGTSMASPMVAGTFLLLQELAKEETGFFIKASTLKGLALHTADQVEGPGPNAIYGWGIMNAKRAAKTLINNGTHSIVEELTLNQDESYSFEVESNGLEKLQVSISWTDPAGELDTGTINDTLPKLVNNLDVKVEKDSITYYPWRLTDVHQNANDDENNVDPFERIDIENASGTYTVTVSHKGTLEDQKQDYALIITGIEELPETCETPENLVVDEIQPNSFHVSWDENSVSFSSEWFLFEDSDTIDFDNSLNSGFLDNSEDGFLLNSLNENPTSYLLYIRKACGDENHGEWLIFPIQSNCEVVEAPYFQNFNSEDQELPFCWHKNTLSKGWKVKDTVSSSYGEFYQENLFSEDSIAFVEPQPNHQKPYILTTPKFDISELDTPALQFEYFNKETNENSTTNFEVEIWTENHWELVYFNAGTATNEWQERSINLQDFEDQEFIKARFKVQNSFGNFTNIVGLKNFSIDNGSNCPEPLSIILENVTSTSAQLSFFDNNLATEGYDWVLLNEDGTINDENSWFEHGQLSSSAEDLSIFDLEVFNEYTFFIRSKCADDEVSEWKSSTFITDCSAVMAPYIQTFDEQSLNINPLCWKQTLAYFQWTYVSSMHSGNVVDHTSGEGRFAHLRANTNPNNQIGALPSLWTPVIDVSELETPVLQFFVYNYKDDNSISNSIKVELRDANSDEWQEVYFDNQGETDDWKEVKINIKNYVDSNEVQARFIGNNLVNNRRIGLDDIGFIEGPNCFKPYDLTVESLSDTEVNFSWASNSDLNTDFEWVIIEKNIGSIQDSSTWINTGVVESDNLNAIGQLLEPSIFYTIYLRSLCEENQQSEWVNVDFLTECVALPMPYYQDFTIPDNVDLDFPFCWEHNDLSNGFWRVYNNQQVTQNNLQIGNPPSQDYNYPMINSNLISNNGSDIYLTSPVIDIGNAENAYLQFQLYHHSNWNDLNEFEVDLFDGENWNQVYVHTEHNKNIWELVTIDLSNQSTDGNIQARFKVDNTSSISNSIAINDVYFTSCPQPKAPKVTHTHWEGAEFEWEGIAENSLGYTWVIIEEGDEISNESSWIDSGETDLDEAFASSSNLLESTDYRIYVRTRCEENTNSAWSYTLFSTDCIYLTAPFTQNFDDSIEFPDCWNRTTAKNVFQSPWGILGGEYHIDNTTGEGNFVSMRNNTQIRDHVPNQSLETPYVDISELENPSIEFFFTNDLQSDDDLFLKVELWNGNEWLTVYNDILLMEVNWVPMNIELLDYEITGPVRAKFQIDLSEASTNGYLRFDDISFKEGPDCYTPLELEILSTSATEVEFTWADFTTSTEYTWYIYEKGASPVENEALLSGNSINNQSIASDFNTPGIYDYEVYVMSNCNGLESNLSQPREFTLEVCEPEDKCEFTIELFAYEFSNGWNGNSIDIYQDGQYITTLGKNFTEGNFTSETAFLCDGMDFEMRPGDSVAWPNSMGFSIYHDNGTLLYSHPLQTGLNEEGLFYKSHVDCNNCLVPTNFNLVNTGLNDAEFEWDSVINPTTENSYSLTIYHLNDDPATDEPVSSIQTAETSISISNLASETAYKAYVQASCVNETTSSLSEAIAFNTGYCIPTSSDTFHHIQEFSVFGALSNVQVLKNELSNNSFMTASENDFIQTFPGGSFDFLHRYSFGFNNVKIWIDYNQDFIFDEDELVFSNNDNETEKYGEISIPEELEEGTYRMRVRSGVFFDGLNPCDFHLQTETLDFNLEIHSPPEGATLQFINNYYDEIHHQLSLYVNNELMEEVDEIEFRHASPFVQLPHGDSVDFKIQSSNQEQGSYLYQTSIDIENGNNYTFIANNGLESPTNSLDFNLYNQSKTVAYAPNETDLLFYHGTSNLNEIEVEDLLNENLIFQLNYSEFEGYFAFQNQQNAIGLKFENEDDFFAQYLIPVPDLDINNETATIITSGVLDGASTTEEEFGLWLAKVSGGELIQLIEGSLTVEDFSNDGLMFFPNPVSSVLNIESKNKIYNAQVYNALGQLLINRKTNAKQFNLDFSSFENGIYLIQLNTKMKTQSFKIIKN